MRRAALPSRRAILLGLLTAPLARALGRTPYGGTLRIDLPFALDRLDPHASDDPASGLLATALFDTLYAWDASGRPYPALARALPEPMEDGSRVTLRPGLVTARGRNLDGADVVWSIERARRLGARPLFSGFGAVRRASSDPLSVHVAGASPDGLADALSSPVAAIVPRVFTAKLPDGTGAFRADATPAGWALTRNDRAARGPSFLDRVDVRRTADLATGLRDFESGDADVGFLGAGLHRRRADAIDFHTEPCGWVLFRTGAEAGEWGAPGVAARLVEGLDRARLSHLGLSPVVASPGSAEGWGGPPANLYVDEASPYFVEVARAVSAALSRPGHEIRPSPLPYVDLAKLRDGGHFALMIDFARRLGPTPRHAVSSLFGSANRALAENPPRGARDDIAVVVRTLSLAVLGELGIVGARAPDLRELEQWDLGSVWRSL